MPDIPFDSLHSMACVTTIVDSAVVSASQGLAGADVGTGVVVDQLLRDNDDCDGDGIVVVSACQGKGARPVDVVGRDIAQNILRM